LQSQLKLLINLQEIDSSILEKQQILNKIPSRITEQEVQFKKVQTTFDRLKQELESFEKKKRNKERELDEINEKIRKMKARISEIKTNKEYQAHLKEIESAEKERYTLEDEILDVMEEMDASSKGIKFEEEKVKAVKSQLDAFKKKLEEEAQEAEKELLTVKNGRTRIIQDINKEIYNLYMSLIKSGKGVAVTEVKMEVCQGCNMNIPPQLYVEIKKGEEIFQCPQCHRILYFKSNS